MRFNLETIKEYLTQNENEWCGTDDWWGDADTLDDTIISVNVYSVEVFVDEKASPDDYGVTIYEIGIMEDGYYEPEKDECIIGQLYFKHIKKNYSEGKLFRVTDVVDYENHVFNNDDPRNPIEIKP